MLAFVAGSVVALALAAEPSSATREPPFLFFEWVDRPVNPADMPGDWYYHRQLVCPRFDGPSTCTLTTIEIVRNLDGLEGCLLNFIPRPAQSISLGLRLHDALDIGAYQDSTTQLWFRVLFAPGESSTPVVKSVTGKVGWAQASDGRMHTMELASVPGKKDWVSVLAELKCSKVLLETASKVAR
jgi:hypothetical protein